MGAIVDSGDDWVEVDATTTDLISKDISTNHFLAFLPICKLNLWPDQYQMDFRLSKKLFLKSFSTCR